MNRIKEPNTYLITYDDGSTIEREDYSLMEARIWGEDFKPLHTIVNIEETKSGT